MAISDWAENKLGVSMTSMEAAATIVDAIDANTLGTVAAGVSTGQLAGIAAVDIAVTATTTLLHEAISAVVAAAGA
jgi:hypothetical protein